MIGFLIPQERFAMAFEAYKQGLTNNKVRTGYFIGSQRTFFEKDRRFGDLFQRMFFVIQ